MKKKKAFLRKIFADKFFCRGKPKAVTQGGFTLIEMVVTMAIVSIMLVGILSVTSSTMKHYNELNILADAKSISNNLCDYIEGKLQYANSMTIYQNYTSPPTGTGSTTQYILEIQPDGKMSYGEISSSTNNAFADSYYDRYSFDITITGSGKIIDISIQTSQKGEGIHTSLNSLCLDNMVLASADIAVDDGGDTGGSDYIVITLP